MILSSLKQPTSVVVAVSHHAKTLMDITTPSPCTWRLLKVSIKSHSHRPVSRHSRDVWQLVAAGGRLPIILRNIKRYKYAQIRYLFAKSRRTAASSAFTNRPSPAEQPGLRGAEGPGSKSSHPPRFTPRLAVVEAKDWEGRSWSSIHLTSLYDSKL